MLVGVSSCKALKNASASNPFLACIRLTKWEGQEKFSFIIQSPKAEGIKFTNLTPYVTSEQSAIKIMASG
jgi:hypothetical protein